MRDVDDPDVVGPARDVEAADGRAIPYDHVETGFTRRVNHIRMRGNAAKLHLALDGLPTIEGLSKKDFAERMVIAPDEHYVERAFNPAKYGEASPEP